MAGAVSVGGRFRLAYIALAALVGGAVGTFIVLQRQPPPPPPKAWSAWHPTAFDPVERQRQIASHVGVQYRLQGGKKLVDVLVRGPSPDSDPIRGVVVAKGVGDRVQESDFAKTTVMYTLCGDGPKCSIAEGQPSVARGIVLRREALELALYTLRYIDDVGAVIAFFPPKKGDSPTAAFLFTKREFSDELHSPLRQTLPLPKPPVPERLTQQEGELVDSLTAPYAFSFSVEESKSGARVLVLAPPSTG